MYIRLYRDLFAQGTLNVDKQINVDVTQLIRTTQSANEYMNGLLQFTASRPNLTFDTNNNYLLKYPDYCTKYLQIVKKNKTSCPEELRFNANSTKLKTYKQRFLNKVGVDLSGIGQLGSIKK